MAVKEKGGAGRGGGRIKRTGNPIRDLRDEVARRVETALKRGSDINIAGVRLNVTDVGGGQIYVPGIGRVDKPTTVARGGFNSVFAEVMGQIRGRYETPEDALDAL